MLHGVRKETLINDKKTRNRRANSCTKTVKTRDKYGGKLASLEEGFRAIYDRHGERQKVTKKYNVERF